MRACAVTCTLQGGIEKLSNLRVLFMSNNKIASWSEIDRLAALDKLEDLLLTGNPLYNDYKDNNATIEYRIEVRENKGSGSSVCTCWLPERPPPL